MGKRIFTSMIGLALSIIVFNPVLAQRIIWQKVLRYSDLDPLGRYPYTELIGGVNHPNGGILGIGISSEYGKRFGAFNNSFVNGFTSVRISASGDSLSVQRIPGVSNGGVGPIVIGPDPASTQGGFLALSPVGEVVDTLQPTSTYNLLLHLDSSGRCTDSIPLMYYDWHRTKVYPESATLLSNNSILVCGQISSTDSNGALQENWSIAKLSLPFGIAEWHRVFRVSNAGNYYPRALLMPGGRIWLTGAAGPHWASVILDTNGTALDTRIHFSSPAETRVGVIGTTALPGKRMVAQIGWGQGLVSGQRKNGGIAQMVIDSTGGIVWQRRKIWPWNYNIQNGDWPDGPIIGANTDGGFNQLMKAPSAASDVYSIVRRAADSTIIAIWPTVTSGLEGYIKNGIYAGEDKAFLLGAGSDPRRWAYFGYYAAYVSGYGQPYIPTSLKAVSGPRAPIKPETLMAYPNPTQGKVQLKLENQSWHGKLNTLRVRSLTTVQVLFTQSVLEAQDGVDLSVYPAGIYLLEALDSSGLVLARGRVVRE